MSIHLFIEATDAVRVIGKVKNSRQEKRPRPLGGALLSLKVCGEEGGGLALPIMK